MSDWNLLRRSNWIVPALCGAAGLGAFLLLVGVAVSVAPRPAAATAAYASSTGLPCGRCHTNAAGGGALTAFGKSFAAGGHKVPGKKK